jgi:hypothetical protein
MRPFTSLAVVVFALVAVLQLVRFLAGWPVMIDTVAIPLWASPIAAIVAGGLAFMLWRERRL